MSTLVVRMRSQLDHRSSVKLNTVHFLSSQFRKPNTTVYTCCHQNCIDDCTRTPNISSPVCDNVSTHFGWNCHRHTDVYADKIISIATTIFEFIHILAHSAMSYTNGVWMLKIVYGDAYMQLKSNYTNEKIQYMHSWRNSSQSPLWFFFCWIYIGARECWN